MDLSNLEQLVSFGESETIEFKKSTSHLFSVGETLCAFLNGNGGQVFIGVGADGKLIGQHITDSTLREVATMLTKIDPPNMVEMEVLKFKDEKSFLIFTTHPSKIYRPFTFEGRSYQRIGSTTSIMPHQTYQKHLLDKMHSNKRWESEIALGYQITDLDPEEILRTSRLGVQAARIPESVGDNITNILDRLELRKNGQLINAAVVLFGTKFLPDYPQCQIRLARFRGIDKSEFLDQNQLHGNAFYLLQEAMLFLRRHLPVAGKILPDVLERKDDPLFPLEALRETLVNALCHRTYMRSGGGISVAIFDNRLEIWSDGELPFDLEPEDLKQDHQSLPRNPVITNVFYRRGLIEQWGRGTQKIIELCLKAGLPEPEFLEQAGSVVVKFILIDHATPSKAAHELSHRQKQILDLLSTKDSSFSEIKLNISNPPADRTIRDDLQQLKRSGLILSKGRGKNSIWYIVK